MNKRYWMFWKGKISQGVLIEENCLNAAEKAFLKLNGLEEKPHRFSGMIHYRLKNCRYL